MILALLISAFMTIVDSSTVAGVTRVDHATLHFRWDNVTYDNSYLDNAEAAALLTDLIQKMGPERIDSVSVTAYASPEGVYEHNLLLSKNRAREFSRILQPEISKLGISVKVRPGGEAWDLLRARVVADSTMSKKAKERILSQLDDNSISVATRKWRFMHGSLGATREEGDVYHWLLLNHYRYLRCLDIVIHYKDMEEPEPASPEAETTQPEPETEITEPVAPETEITEMPEEADKVPEQIADEPISARRPLIGVSTNLLYDFTYIPNYGITSIPQLSLEYYPEKGKYSFGADMEFSHWLHPDIHKYNQIRNLTFWGRRYFKREEDRFKGAYLLANMNAAQYGIGWDAKGWEGEGLGLSAGGGYKLYLGKYFFLDMGGALGLFYSGYDPYVWGNDPTGRYYYDYSGNPDDFSKRSKRLLWFGPTRIYISIGFDIYGRRR